MTEPALTIWRNSRESSTMPSRTCGLRVTSGRDTSKTVLRFGPSLQVVIPRHCVSHEKFNYDRHRADSYPGTREVLGPWHRFLRCRGQIKRTMPYQGERLSLAG